MRLLIFCAICLLSLSAHRSEAATVCVILQGNVVVTEVPCGEIDSPPQTVTTDADARVTAFRAGATSLQLPTKAQKTVTNAIAAGITLTCSTYADLNGARFSIGPDVLGYLDSIRGLYKINGNSFPTAAGVPVISDASGTPHSIVTLAEFTALDDILTLYASQLQTYLAKIIAGQSPVLPATTSTAC